MQSRTSSRCSIPSAKYAGQQLFLEPRSLPKNPKNILHGSRIKSKNKLSLASRYTHGVTINQNIVYVMYEDALFYIMRPKTTWKQSCFALKVRRKLHHISLCVSLQFIITFYFYFIIRSRSWPCDTLANCIPSSMVVLKQITYKVVFFYYRHGTSVEQFICLTDGDEWPSCLYYTIHSPTITQGVDRYTQPNENNVLQQRNFD